jgi:hypothetical protein
MGKGNSSDSLRPFKITAYTGAKVQRGYGDIIIDVAGMSAKESMPVLREHERDRIVGFSEKYWKEQSKFFISGNMSNSTPDGIEISSLADEGFPWQASIGVWAKSIVTLSDENASALVNGQLVVGPIDIWRESVVGEVSFCVLGADSNTSATVMSRPMDGGSTLANYHLQTSPEGEEKWKAEFARSADLQHEFQGCEERYLSFKTAESKGLAKVIRGGTVN